MRFSLQVADVSLGATTDDIDKLSAALKLYKNEVYPAKVFLDVYDTAMATSSEVLRLVEKLQDAKLGPAAAARATKNNLLDAMGKLWQEGDPTVGVLQRRARCTLQNLKCDGVTPIPPSPLGSYLMPVPGFRYRVIELFRQALRTKETCEFLAKEYGQVSGWTALIFDVNSKIDGWIADRTKNAIDVAKGEVDPYIEEKTDEALDKARAEAEQIVADQKAGIGTWIFGAATIVAVGAMFWMTVRGTGMKQQPVISKRVRQRPRKSRRRR